MGFLYTCIQIVFCKSSYEYRRDQDSLSVTFDDFRSSCLTYFIPYKCHTS